MKSPAIAPAPTFAEQLSAELQRELPKRGWNVANFLSRQYDGKFACVSFRFDCPCGRPLIKTVCVSSYGIERSKPSQGELISFYVERMHYELQSHVDGE